MWQFGSKRNASDANNGADTTPDETNHGGGLVDKRLRIRPGHDSTDEDTGHGRNRATNLEMGQSIHGESAAKRRAITELLFFASVGDLRRCQRIVRIWNLRVADAACCDYDRRTPLHLAASEGAYKVTAWLLAEPGVQPNPLDRFGRTPLEDAVRGDHAEVAKLLVAAGGRVLEDGGLVDVAASRLAGAFGIAPAVAAGGGAAAGGDPFPQFDPEWEIDPASLTILEKLGEGEFGVVHRARWYGTFVAAKILKGSSDIALGDFRGEVEILRRVHHPNAVQFLGACTRREPYILVTELMAGGSLADAFRLPQVFPLRRGVEVALDAARGLAYLHNRKPSPIIHRDLKPGNLMFSGSQYSSASAVVFDTGSVKMADFGLSKTLPVNKHADLPVALDCKFRLTGETGSYRYMAPEVFRHEPYNALVDVYSFSMIMYQVFEYQPPFAGVDPVEAARQAAMYGLRPTLRALAAPGDPVRRELRALVERCWSPSPDDRPDFVEVSAALERILERIPRAKLTAAAGGDGGGGGCCAVS